MLHNCFGHKNIGPWCLKYPMSTSEDRLLAKKIYLLCQKNPLQISEFSQWKTPLPNVAVLRHALLGAEFFDNPSNSDHTTKVFLMSSQNDSA
jgi:hypothetical protein